MRSRLVSPVVSAELAKNEWTPVLRSAGSSRSMRSVATWRVDRNTPPRLERRPWSCAPHSRLFANLAIDGADGCALLDCSAAGAVANDIPPCQALDGILGSSVSTGPGPPTDGGNMAVCTRSDSSACGSDLISGVPVRTGSVTSTSPSLIDVCRHEEPDPPISAASPAQRPPLDMRSTTTCATEVSTIDADASSLGNVPRTDLSKL